ncbi:MAG: DUF2344 domain-containing protein [Tissierellia bacterium]|nr:DUF2344 domain-containing protein [Tissierellia bacterium]
MILWIRFTKQNFMKYISHLDLMRLFQRSFRRCNIPIKYSQGFNPQPKMAIANPLALGTESFEEYMEIELTQRIPEDDFIKTMNKDLPEGIKILDAKYVDEKKSITTYIDWSHYEIQFMAYNVADLDTLEASITGLLERDQIIIERERRKGNKVITKNVDIRPLIGNITLSKDKTVETSEREYLVTINCLLKSGDRGNLKPIDLLKALDKNTNMNIEVDTADIRRIKIFTEGQNSIEPLM